VPVKKNADPTNIDPEKLTASTMIYASTELVQGKAVGVVTATGMQTHFIGNIVAAINSANDVEPPLQRKLNQLGNWLVYGSIVVCVILFAIAVPLDQGADPNNSNPVWLQMLLIAVVPPATVSSVDAAAPGSALRLSLPPVLSTFSNQTVFVAAFSPRHGASIVSGGATCRGGSELAAPLLPVTLSTVDAASSTASSFALRIALPAHISGATYESMSLTLTAVPGGGAGTSVQMSVPYSLWHLQAHEWRSPSTSRIIRTRLAGLRPSTVRGGPGAGVAPTWSPHADAVVCRASHKHH
jgi:hypothetical protein